MDDANIPGLLSLPYLGYVDKNDPVYLNTREALLSTATNPYFFEGRAGEGESCVSSLCREVATCEASSHILTRSSKGIGGPHAGYGMIWPMSIIVRALTTDDEEEIASCLETLLHSTAGTGYMHESFWKEDVR